MCLTATRSTVICEDSMLFVVKEVCLSHSDTTLLSRGTQGVLPSNTER